MKKVLYIILGILLTACTDDIYTTVAADKGGIMRFEAVVIDQPESRGKVLDVRENNVTRDFYLGRPSGVDWLSDNDAVTISGSKATVAPNFTGDVTLTATSGKYDREIILTVDSTGGVNGVDADSEVMSEKFFTLSGMEVAKPEAADGEIYIVVRTFANGNTATSKFVNNK